MTSFFCFLFSANGSSASETTEGIGGATDGIYATGKYSPHYPGDGNFVQIFVHFTPPSTNINYISPFEIGKYQIAQYFCATNSFIGLIELKDASGEKVSVLKPWVNHLSAYPDSYNLKQTRHDLINRPELPDAITGLEPEAGNFHLKDYFLIQNPGDYQLIVWPKIYKKSETNGDLVKRIDLPSVNIPIHWTEPLHRFKISTRLASNSNEITTNNPIEVLIHCQNDSTNETYVIYNQFPVEFDETFSFAIFSPSGKDITPKLPRLFGGSSSRDFLASDESKEFTIDLRGVLRHVNFEESGTYQIVGRKRVLTMRDNLFWDNWVTVASNPLNLVKK